MVRRGCLQCALLCRIYPSVLKLPIVFPGYPAFLAMAR